MEKTASGFDTQTKSAIENEFENLIISKETEGYLLSTSKWSVFIAIVGFIFAALLFLVGIAMMFLSKFSSEYQDFQSLPGGMMTYLGLLYFFLSVLYFLPSLFLIQFAIKIKKSISNRIQAELEDGFKKMKMLALVVGILTILMLVMVFTVPFIIGIFTAAKQIGGL